MALKTLNSLIISLAVSVSTIFAEYVLDNGENIRLISSSSTCDEGRIELYNGSAWGTFSDCTHSLRDPESICKTLGWEYDIEKWVGASSYPTNLSMTSYIAYTVLANCSEFPSEHDICSECTFTRNMQICGDLDTVDIHNEFDIFLRCGNYGGPDTNDQYGCIPFDSNNNDDDDDDSMYNGYTACDSVTSSRKKWENNGTAIAVLTVAILGSMLAVIVYAVYTKCQETKRLALLSGNGRRKSNYNYRNYGKKSGFATVPQGSLELQMGSVRNNNSEYKAQPQAVFRKKYKTRNGDRGRDTIGSGRRHTVNGYNGYNGYEEEDNDEANLTVDHSPGAVGGGYDMEEIIPNVIYSTNNNVSESYGLIKNHDEDDEETLDVRDTTADTNKGVSETPEIDVLDEP